MIDLSFKVKETKSELDFSEFVIEPLESGYGYTLGHALRRVLLTSIAGVAVTSLKIAGVKHKFSELPGLQENIVDLLLNIKGLCISLPESKDRAVLKLLVKGEKKITAKDIEVSDGAEITNPDYYLGHLSGDKAKLDMELTVERGYGYSLSEERPTHGVDEIPTDAVFSPVKRVNYFVESTRVGRKTNFDKLILQVWTNGAISARQALDQSAKILASYFMQIYDPKASNIQEETQANSKSLSNDLLKTTVDELDLPTRIYNSLRNGGIETIAQLLETTKKDLVSMRNMGSKSITVIEEKLREKGISLTV